MLKCKTDASFSQVLPMFDLRWVRMRHDSGANNRYNCATKQSVTIKRHLNRELRRTVNAQVSLSHF